MKKLLTILLLTSVFISGCVLFQQKQDVIPSDSEGSQIDTSDWKTYRNEEYGFEFKYPEEWSIDNSSKNILFYDESRTNSSHKTPLIGIYFFDGTNIADHIKNNFFDSSVEDAIKHGAIWRYEDNFKLGNSTGIYLRVGDSITQNIYLAEVQNKSSIIDIRTALSNELEQELLLSIKIN